MSVKSILPQAIFAASSLVLGLWDFGAASAAPVEAAKSAPKRLTVLPEIEFFPGVSTLTSEGIYFTRYNSLSYDTASKCPQSDLYRVRATKAEVEKVATIPCVLSLQTVDDKVFIESEKVSQPVSNDAAQKTEPESLKPPSIDSGNDEPVWTVWDGAKAQPLATAMPQFQNSIPAMRLALFSLGGTKNALATRLRKAKFQSLQFHGEGNRSWTVLVRTPEEAGTVPRYAVATGSLDGKAPINAAFLDIPDGLFVQSLRISEKKTGFAVLANSEGRHQIQAFNLLTGENEAQMDSGFDNTADDSPSVRLGKITSLVVLNYADALIIDLGDGKAQDSAVWRFDKSSLRLVRSATAARDITALNVSADGLLVSRRGGIGWWGTPQAEKTPSNPTQALSKLTFPSQADSCAAYRIVPDGSERLLFSRQAQSNGDVELVEIMRLSGLLDLRCGKETAAILAARVTPKLNQGRLKVGLAQDSALPLTESNVPTALSYAQANYSVAGNERIHSSENNIILLSLQGPELKWVREPLAGTFFGSIANVPNTTDTFAVELKDSKLQVPYGYGLKFDAVGRRVQHFASTAGSNTPIAPTVSPADVAAEMAALVDKRAVKLYSFKPTSGLAVEPALVTYVAANKSVYFTERATGACYGRNLWKLTPVAGKKTAPERVGVFPCVTSLFTDTRSLWVATQAGTGRDTQYWNDAAKNSSQWWKGLSASELWKIDLWLQASQQSISVRSLRLTSLERNGQSVKLLLRPLAPSSEAYVIQVSTKPEDETKVPLAATVKSDAKTPEAVEFILATGGDVFEFRNPNAPNQLAQIVSWKLAQSADSLTYSASEPVGGSTPYMYAEVWNELPADEWSARKVAFPAVTPHGLVFFDGTSRLNEWPVGTYYSPQLASAPNAFTRLKGMTGTRVSGLQYVSGGILYSDRTELMWIGGTPPIPSQVAQAEGKVEGATDTEEELIRDDAKPGLSGGDK